MTCGHCASSVTRKLQKLPGVMGVNVDVNPGGVSTVTVTVTSATVISSADVRKAVAEAGYDVTDS